VLIATDEKDADYQFISLAQKEYQQIKSDTAKSFKTGLRIEEQIKFRKQLQPVSEVLFINLGSEHLFNSNIPFLNRNLSSIQSDDSSERDH